MKALVAEGYDTPTPIQAKSIPHLLAGADLLGVAQTGTGKTAAFALPILTHLNKINRQAGPRACRTLILAPTRELASQIQASFVAYGKFMRLTSTVVFGGVPVGRQIRAVANGIDIVVATPGRLLDLLDQRALTLNEVEIFVLDEADRMLDMGFVRDIKKIIAKLPARRQNLFFSATMPKEISELAGSMLTKPVQVEVTPAATTVERIEQRIIFCPTRQKQAVLHKLLEDKAIERAVVFARTKHGADRVAKHLAAAGIPADAIHGNKSQGQRERAMAAFKSGRTRLLIATDIAARGIDVDGVTHVINFDLPNIAESYVHRIGRTARAGADGSAISLVADDERSYLRDIERLIRRRIDILPLPEGLAALPALAEPERQEQPRGNRQPRRQGAFPQGERAGGRGGQPGGRPGQHGAGRRSDDRRSGVTDAGAAARPDHGARASTGRSDGAQRTRFQGR
jgi:ATP-dependent RNA helicase RhlE